jgi:hypothetical protein
MMTLMRGNRCDVTVDMLKTNLSPARVIFLVDVRCAKYSAARNSLSYVFEIIGDAEVDEREKPSHSLHGKKVP